MQGPPGPVPSGPEQPPANGPQPRAVLLIRPGAMGDIVMASGLPGAMRAAWPRARIHWLVDPRYAELLRHHPHLSGLIPLSVSARSLRPGGLARGLQLLRHGGYDLVVDAQGLLKSILLARITGAPLRLGLASREGGNGFMTTTVPRAAGGGLFGADYSRLALALGLDARAARPRIVLSAQAHAQARDWLHDQAVDGPHMLLCPYTTRPQKSWPQAHWHGLLTRIRQRLGLSVVVVGGPGDRRGAQQLVRGHGFAHAAAGEMPLAVSAALAASAALVIGVDTGMTHLGVAFRRPTVALFGSTRPYTFIDPDDDQDRLRVLYRDLPCAPCRRHPTCAGAYTCLVGLPPERVMAAAEELMAHGNGGG